MPLFPLGAILAELSWLESTAALLGLGVLAVLAGQLWRAQRRYALELAELSRQVAEEQEKAGQVRQEKEAMARESQAKSEILATLSREIRSHLNGIMGSADLMLDDSLKPQQREHLATLRASAQSLHQALNDVLDYSGIETGQIQIGVAPFNLWQPLVEVVEALSPLARWKKLELVLIVAPDAPLQVSGDAIRLRQVLFNLMSNAVKFTARGRVVLRVEVPQGSAAPSKAGAKWLHFSVSDTGAAIPENLQATIFERPAQSDTATARRFGGSGLELAISKRLVELMGGRIGAQSLPEGGSEFWVVLPLLVAKEQAPAAAPPAGLHVVVLDDLAAARIAAAALLTRLGIDQDATDTVAKAAVFLREALDAGARELVLLLDESSAQNGAKDLTRLLAPDSPLRATRIVLMAQSPEEVNAAALEFPVTAVVRKPLLGAEALQEALCAAPGIMPVGPTGSRTPVDAGADSTLTGRRGPHVLVVDDDVISRSVSSQLLERLGCVVEVALGGTEAVELARRTAFDLIFMDCQMPEMDGFEATQDIRAAIGDKTPPIVALTASITKRDQERCVAAGMCDFVGKPVNKAELARILKRWAHPTGGGA